GLCLAAFGVGVGLASVAVAAGLVPRLLLARALPLFFFSSRRRHTRSKRDWSSDVCSSDLPLSTRTSCTSFQVPSYVLLPVAYRAALPCRRVTGTGGRWAQPSASGR